MEYRAFIPHTLLATAQSPKILRCPRYDICSQKHDNSADVGVSNLDVKVHLRILLGFLTLCKLRRIVSKENYLQINSQSLTMAPAASMASCALLLAGVSLGESVS